jgi:glycosyltransferase involved in cell wall biosynthesis
MAALDHGLPVVTTEGRLTEPLWAESGAVALAPANNIQSMVRQTERLLADEAAQLRLRIASRTFYQERFALGRTIAALREAQP